jgi:integrase
MAILTECPACHKKQSLKNKLCTCGEDLVKAKRGRRVKYWLAYRVDDKQKREPVGDSLEEARDAEGKRRGQKREGTIFDELPGKLTFSELAEWYLGLRSVQRLASHRRIRTAFANFNEVFGGKRVSRIKPQELEDYQSRRTDQGKSAATIDMELSIVKTMVTKAFDNDMVGGRAVKTFRQIKRRLRPGSNARDRVLTFEEYANLIRAAKPHLKPILIVAYHTGMRKGELLGLQWSHVDRKGFIRLPPDMTKERKPKTIPINHHVKYALEGLPRSLHHDFVFTYKGKPIAEGLRRSFLSACREAGIIYGMNDPKGIRLHDFRTTLKTNMLRAGVDKALRDIIIGHTLKGMDTFYLKPSNEDLVRAMDQYTTWVDTHLKTAVDVMRDK